MKTYKTTTALLCAGLLSACATLGTPYPQAYQTQVIQTWVGQDVSALWESWGPPARTEKASNGYEYQVYQQRVPKAAGTSNAELDLAFAKSSDPNCVTYFIVNPKDKKVHAAHWRGSSCPVQPPSNKALLPSASVVATTKTVPASEPVPVPRPVGRTQQPSAAPEPTGF